MHFEITKTYLFILKLGLYLDPKGTKLGKLFNVHKNSIIKVKSNRDGTILAIIELSGSIFFPVVNKNVPYSLFQTGFKLMIFVGIEMVKRY